MFPSHSSVWVKHEPVWEEPGREWLGVPGGGEGNQEEVIWSSGSSGLGGLCSCCWTSEQLQHGEVALHQKQSPVQLFYSV